MDPWWTGAASTSQSSSASKTFLDLGYLIDFKDFIDLLLTSLT